MTTEYFIQPQPPACECCGRDFERTRIGHSAVGWTFGFDHRPDLGATDKASWLAYLEGRVIEDEYGRTSTPAEFADLVERKEGGRKP